MALIINEIAKDVDQFDKVRAKPGENYMSFTEQIAPIINETNKKLNKSQNDTE